MDNLDNGHLSCFYVLATVNRAAVNIGVHVCFSVWISSGYMPRSGIAGSYGGFSPSFLRSLHTVFHSKLYQFTFPPEMQECSLFSTPSPAFIVCRLFYDGHSDWCEVVSHCSFDLHFSDGDVEHLFMCLLAICMSSLEKCLFRPLSHFLTVLFAFLVLSCISCLYILEINYLSFVSHFEGCLFTLFVVSFVVQKLLSLIRSHLFIFVFISITLAGIEDLAGIYVFECSAYVLL